ncbi:MAG: DUF4314 domain-containing protein [Dorea sp.]
MARLREQYPAGTRICLDSMDGEAGMPQGLEGTVQYVDDAGQLGISWDNGRSLSLIPGVDSFHKKEGQGHPEERVFEKSASGDRYDLPGAVPGTWDGSKGRTDPVMPRNAG